MKHKFLILIAFAVMQSANLLGQCSDFVTVDGKKLKCGGSDFFAVNCNYIFEVVYQTGGATSNYTIDNFFPTREHNAAPDNKAAPQINNRTQAFNAIKKEFLELKAKGFNSLRLIPNGCAYGAVSALDCNTQNSISIPYTHPQHVSLILDVYQSVLDAAKQADLKVIFLLSDVNTSVPYPNYSENPPVPPPPVNMTNGFIDFLGQFAQRFKDNTTLMAVDFVNEPDLKMWENKSAVCNLVKSWNSAIKSRSNILTTVGLCSNHCFSWDPNLMNIDFVSIHPYPILTDTVNISDLPAAINRIKSDFWWCRNNITIPWMVGETGFQAHPKNTSHPINATARWSEAPWSGTLGDQAEYLNATLNAARDFGGVGYSWWAQSDGGMGDPANGQYYNRPNVGLYWGLTYANEGDIPTTWKPAINYVTSFNPAVINTPTQPTNYFNYFNTGTTGKYVQGNVRTASNVPIKDAIIEVFDVNNKYYATYSDANGDFLINTLTQIANFKVTATECNQYMESGPFNQVTRLVTLIKIDRSVVSSLSYANQVVTGVVVNEHSSTNATFSNYQITGSNFHVTAFDYIRLNPGTSVNSNNDFSATIGNYYHNCSEIVDNSNTPFRENPGTEIADQSAINSMNKTQLIEETITGEQELNRERKFVVYPSPSNGQFVVSTNSKEEKHLTVINSLGVVVHKDKFSNQDYHLNLSLASGVYFVEINDSNGKSQQKIVIER